MLARGFTAPDPQLTSAVSEDRGAELRRPRHYVGDRHDAAGITAAYKAARQLAALSVLRTIAFLTTKSLGRAGEAADRLTTCPTRRAPAARLCPPVRRHAPSRQSGCPSRGCRGERSHRFPAVVVVSEAGETDRMLSRVRPRRRSALPTSSAGMCFLTHLNRISRLMFDLNGSA